MMAIASTRITPAAQVTAGLDSPKSSDAAAAGGAICWEWRMASPFCAYLLTQKGLISRLHFVARLERRRHAIAAQGAAILSTRSGRECRARPRGCWGY